MIEKKEDKLHILQQSTPAHLKLFAKTLEFCRSVFWDVDAVILVRNIVCNL